MNPLKAPAKRSRRWQSLKRGHILARAAVPDFIEKDGETFFQTGRRIVNWLDHFGKSLRKLPASDLELFYCSSFCGTSLGLTKLDAARERDGIRELRFTSDNRLGSTKDALNEWKAYIDSFVETEEFALHLHKLETWSGLGPFVATVRLNTSANPAEHSERPLIAHFSASRGKTPAGRCKSAGRRLCRENALPRRNRTSPTSPTQLELISKINTIPPSSMNLSSSE